LPELVFLAEEAAAHGTFQPSDTGDVLVVGGVEGGLPSIRLKEVKKK
jgi:hypothetical protein